MKCSGCGIELKAINISDIEPEMCQACVIFTITNMELIPEDPEIAKMSDGYIEDVISGKVKCYQNWNKILASCRK